jgi:peptide/nickel transport system permease protein
MILHLCKKITEAAAVILIVTAFAYILIGLMPGDPIDMMLAANPNASAEDAARLKALHGLDKPLWERYIGWLSHIVQGDFGYSRLFNQPVLPLVMQGFMNTLILLGCAMILALVIALPLGVYSGYKPHSFLSKAIDVVCYAGISIPPFWLALMLITLFAVSFGWFPAGGMPDDESSFFERFQYLALPVMALTLASIGGYTRYIRAGVIEALSAEHIRTARAKGLSEARVVLRHALPHALIPVITLVALDFGTLFSGAVITETIFNWRGMGRLLYDAIMGNDYMLAMCCMIVITAMIVFANMMADILYRIVDPRIRSAAQSTSEKTGVA